MDTRHKKLPYFDQKTGGLFDEGFASDKRYVTGSDSASDLLTSIDNGSDILTLDNMDTFNPLFGEMDPFADASLDSFVDLSEYLMENSTNITDVVDVTPDTLLLLDSDTSATTKRSWNEVVAYVDSTEPVNHPTTPDHDYSAKKPRLKSTSDDELNDVPSTSTKITRYRVRREKNNVASKRSREIRKTKFSDMEQQADILVVENEKMREKIVELEGLAAEMKTILVARLSGK